MKNKLNKRLSQLEKLQEQKLAKRDNVDVIWIAALLNETDQEAIAKRLEQPQQNQFQICVLRREGTGIKSIYYDQQLNLSYEGAIIYHPDDPKFNGTFNNILNKDDFEGCWQWYNNMLLKVER